MHGYCSWTQSNSFGAPGTTAVTGRVNDIVADNMFCSLSLIGCFMQIIYSLSADAALIQNCRQYGPAQNNLILQQVPGCSPNASLTGTQIKGVPLHRLLSSAISHDFTPSSCTCLLLNTRRHLLEGKDKIQHKVSQTKVKEIHWVSCNRSYLTLRLRVASAWTNPTLSTLKWLYYTLVLGTSGGHKYLGCI